MSTEPKVLALGFLFDATKVAPQTAPEAVPAGWYPVAIKDANVTPIDNGQGKRVALIFEIIDGLFKGRQIFDGLNVQHSNAQAQSIAQGQLSAICHAVQVYQLASMDLLFGKPFMAKFGVEPGRWVNADNETIEVPAGGTGPAGSKFYDAKNQFKGCKAIGAGGPAAAAPGAPGGTPPGWAVPAPGATPPPAAPGTPPPPFAAPNAGATPPPPFATPAAAPAASTAVAGKPKGKPGRPPKAKPERKFFVAIEQPEFAEAITESKLIEYYKQGMPANTEICLEGEDQYKTGADYAVGVATATPPPAAVTPPPVTAPTPPPVAPPVVPPTATPPPPFATPTGPAPWNR